MDKRKIEGCVVNQPHAHRLHATVLWSLSAIVAILLSSQAMVYAADDSARSSHQEHSLIVRNWKGEYIGTSHHVVMDPSAGNIVFVIVSLETGQSKRVREIAVPWVLFSVDKENRALVLSISEKQLNSASEYHASDLEDPGFVGRTYHFFGLAPPWTEEMR
ncbi:MAG: PRC-barrel domain-containing protein [Thermodesulfobacteriota bacterium]